MLTASCVRDFSSAHVGFNDITRHTKALPHHWRFKDCSSSSTQGLACMLGQSTQLSHIHCAEVIMLNFIAMHNLSFDVLITSLLYLG